MPNAPPTLGVIRRSISFGILSTASASGSRTKCGPCVAVYRVERPLAGSKSAMALRGSSELTTTRLLTSSSRDNTSGPRECRVGRLGVAHVIVPVEDDLGGNGVET